ncbi:MAG: mycofactocin biosynthesis glycosyltransferase MftF [Microthrixaceae bacterium]|nr:mycofactocin biosynthesis glycosyltransferase MftF [Microthrixaceae bacterium]
MTLGVTTRWVRDSTVRIDYKRNTVLGGSPLKLMKLTDRGIAVIERLTGLPGGRPSPASGIGVAPTGLSRAEVALVDRLVDSGLIHSVPEPGQGPYGVSNVTIVIPVKDDPTRLAALIDEINRTTPGIAGVVVVDDGSVIPVELPVQEFDIPVRVIRRDTNGGPARARMDGLEAVETEIVAFVDVDCTPTEGWLELLLGHFADGRVVVAAPRIAATPIATRRSGHHQSWLGPFLEDYDGRHSPLDLGVEPARVFPGTRVSYVPSAALVARSSAVRERGGFDPELRFGEDVDLIWRLAESGERIRYDPRAVLHHEVRPKLWSWLRQRFSYGSSAAPLAKRHGDSVAPVNISRWSLAVWLLIAAGNRRAALSIAGLSALLFVRKVPGCSTGEVTRIVGAGHLGAGRQLATTLVRVWWPIAFAASVVSKRARRIVATAVLWQIIDHHPQTPVDVVLGLADDMAYGAGVSVGCVRERSATALRPKLS